MTDLDERKAAILRAIVEQYVETAQPVGSQTVTQTTGLGVSAATVRNEMSVLEREGYITQPHTSAGRVPTDRGYRYYVDQLAGAAQLAAPERRRIAEFFTSATMAMDELLSETSLLLGLVLKEIFRRPRPALEHLDAAGGYSFPSAHTLGGFTFCGIMIYLVMQMRLSLAVKIILAITLFLFACLIGISRIYLHTHYASDTLASLCAAIFWLGLFYILAIVRDIKYFTIS